MMQVSSDAPSAESCAALLHELRTLSAMKRALYRVMPEGAQALIPPLSIVSRAEGGVRIGKVAELLHVDLSVASRHVGHLVERGLLERAPDPADGRASILTVTPEGERKLAEVRRRFAEQIRTYLVGWNDDDVDTLTNLLARLGSSLADAEVEA